MGTMYRQIRLMEHIHVNRLRTSSKIGIAHEIVHGCNNALRGSYSDIDLVALNDYKRAVTRSKALRKIQPVV